MAVRPAQWMTAILFFLQLMSELGSETINTPIYVQMEMAQCHVMTDQLLRYTLLGRVHNNLLLLLAVVVSMHY